MLHYGGITLLTSSAAILVNRIDVLMLGHYLKIENVAFYTVAFFMAVINSNSCKINLTNRRNLY